MAGNPHSSAEYFNGGAVQITVERGTPIIDVSGWESHEELRRLGVAEADIYNLPIDALVRYNQTSDWYAS
jgi:hypothetical protein